MIKARKMNVAPGHLFSGSKKEIPGSLCRNPAALCSEWLLAHCPSMMVSAQGSKSHPDCSPGKSVKELGCTEARTGHGFLQPKCHLVGKSYKSGCNYYGGGRKCNILSSG